MHPDESSRIPLSQYPRVEAPDGRPAEEQPKWRRDFPVDWSQDHYISRRDFAKFLVLTSFAFVVGQGYIVLQEVRRRRRPLPPALRIAAVADVPVGSTLAFSYPGEHDTCILIRTGESTFVAYDNKCTHLHCPVLPDVQTGRIHCPCHNAWFDLATGRPVSGPPRRALPRIALEIRGGDIYATGVDLRTTL